MICLSKADEAFNRHLSWNQSPSPLAAQHTTRQDLNGMANLRAHVDADQDDGSGGSLLLTCEEKSVRGNTNGERGRSLCDAGRPAGMRHS